MPRISAAIIVLAVVIAGCTPATTATSPTPSAASATSVTTDACTLARSDVEPVIGSVTSQQAQTTSVPGTTVGMNVTACVFTSSDGLLTFGVTRAQVSRTDFDNAVKQMPGMQAESGIGDAAFSGTISAAGTAVTSLFVLKGSTYFTLQATSRSKDGAALLAALRTVARKVAGTL
jgi:ribosomal protein L27